MMKYNPTSGILLLTICSLNKTTEVASAYDESTSITQSIPYGPAQKLLNHREYMRLGIQDPTTWDERLEWQGMPLADLNFNQGLSQGSDFAGTILLERLTPTTLGRLVALYEHSVFTQGTIWDINSSHQWGVKLGKALATRIIPEFETRAKCQLKHDRSANTLTRRYREAKELLHGR